ncbi:MAG: Secretion system C-terminal sorting domain, partial [Cytophagaceae bacterium]|nr:Secretion system C-terminal sorting domain [Cytophagaceae bacterium]
RLLSKFVKPNGSAPVGSSPCTVTSSKDEEETTAIMLYPNPSDEAFQLELKGSFQLVIYSADGARLESLDGRDKISFGKNLPAGFYQIRLTAGARTKVLKAVKY